MKCIFIVDKGEEATSPGSIRHPLLYAPCEGMGVVKNEFEFRE